MLNPQSVSNIFGRPANHWLVTAIAADGQHIGAQAFGNRHDAEQTLRKLRVLAPDSTLAAVFNEPGVTS